jgi:hypothetical protein
MHGEREKLFGLMAEFADPDKLLEATREAHEAGYSRIDAFTPFPIEGLAEAMGSHKTLVPLFTLIGGLVGCAGGFFLQYWPNVIGYPLDIGGKPYDSWPSFIPITFELTILFAALSCALGMLAMNGFPSPYHPVFNLPSFERATRDRFFLCIMAQDPKFDTEATKAFLLTLEPQDVSEVAS